MAAAWTKLTPLRSLLFLSICLNAFLAAYVGMQSGGSVKLLPAPAAPPALISRVAGGLPEADAHILRQAYSRREGEISQAQQRSRRALLTAAALLGQGQVDEGALRLAVKDARDKRLAVGDMVIEVFLEAFPKMSAEGRRSLLMTSLP